MRNNLLDIYNSLHRCFGPQHWWPGDSPFEVMVGAVLTQNTSWINVSRAIANLRAAKLLSCTALTALPVEELAVMIRPAGYYNLKARRLKNLLALIDEKYQGRLADFLEEETMELRRSLLSTKGIGPETADSILLYAADRPVFVVDAYTRRFLIRHGLICEEDGYHEIQDLFVDTLPEDAALYNEYHALIVRLGKEFCKKRKPLCSCCPLQETSFFT